MTVERVDADVPAAIPSPTASPIEDHDESHLDSHDELAAAVDDAVIGDVLADLPEARPEHRLASAHDFSGLYVRHRSGLAAHARRFLRDPRDVDEVVQETFLRLFLAISEIETELQAIAFARRTLTNLCIDRYRADRRRPRLIDLESAPVAELPGPLEEDDPVLRAEDAAIVREALARLSPLHRAALVKREIEEKPLPQIAAELDIPEESVKHLLFRARRALRRLLVGTSVEPGVDLSPAEIIDLANRRLARGVMQGANLMIVFLVVAVMAVVGFHPVFHHTSDLVTPSGAGEPATTGGAVPSLPQTTHRRGGHRTTRSGHHAVRDTAPPVNVVPLTPTSAPVHHTPVKPTKSPKAPTISRAHLKLSGPLTVIGAPEVVTSRSTTGANGITAAESSFTAPTNQGTFRLEQAVTTGSSTGTSVAVTPAFVVGNAVETPTMTGSTASVGTDAAGNVTVDLTAGATPDPSTNAFPLTSLTVALVLTPDLSQVLSESVALTAQPVAVTPQPPSVGVVPTSPTTPQPPAAEVSGEPAPTSSGTATPDVVENLRYVG